MLYTMKIFNLFLLAGFISGASANQIQVRVIFNPPLSESDAAAVQAANIEWLQLHGGRKLRGQDHRELSCIPSACEAFPDCPHCQMVFGTCQCTGRRTEEVQSYPPPGMVRELSAHTGQCLDKIDDAISIITGAVTSDSQSIIDNADFTCFEIFAADEQGSACKGVTSYNMWNHTSDEVTHGDFEFGADFCQSSLLDANLEAIVDPDKCSVTSVVFNLNGPGLAAPRVATETGADKYLLFGNDGADILGASDFSFDVGDYELDVIVNLSGGGTKTNSMTIRIRDC